MVDESLLLIADILIHIGRTLLLIAMIACLGLFAYLNNSRK